MPFITPATAIGCVFLLTLLRKWPGWLGAPFVLLLLAVLREVVVGPIGRILFQQEYTTGLISTGATPEEVPVAQLVNLLGAFSLALGMILAHLQTKRRQVSERPVNYALAGPLEYQGWRVALGIAIFGFLCHAYVIGQLLKQRRLLPNLRDRALYYDEAVIYTPLYNYTRMFSSWALTGSWTLLLFSRTRRRLRYIGMAGFALYLAIQVLFGSRMDALVTVLGTGFLVHYGIVPLNKRKIVIYGVSILLSLFLIHSSRESLTIQHSKAKEAGRNKLLKFGVRGTRLPRSEEGVCWWQTTDERQRQAGWIGRQDDQVISTSRLITAR